MAALSDWLTTQQAAQLSGYHPNHIRRLIRTGEIRAQKWGASLMIDRYSLMNYIERAINRGERRGPKPGQVV